MEHYRELGIEAGATHAELVRSYRRRNLELILDCVGPTEELSLDQQRHCAVHSFLVLERLVPEDRSNPPTDGAKTSLYLESEVFRFQRTPLCRLSLDFSPAKAPPAPVYPTIKRAPSRAEDTVKPPLISSLAIGSMIALSLIALLNIVHSERVTSPPPASAVVIKSDKPTAVEPTKPSAVAGIHFGGLVVRTNRPSVNVKLRPNGASQAIVANQISGSVHTFTNLAPGDYLVIASMDGWAPVERLVTVAAQQDVETAIEFRGGSLRLDTDPSGAVVHFGDKVLGKTPLLLTDLTPGKLTVTLQYEWWPASPVTKTIPEGSELSEVFRFPRGRLVVSSSPRGAVLTIDGKEFGKTPLTIEQVPSGQRVIRLSADEYETTEISLTVSDGAELKIQPSLPSSLKKLDPNEVLTAVWSNSHISGRSYEIAPNFERDRVTKPKNGIIRNLDRQKLDTHWLRQKFRYEGTVKNYDSKTGLLEFDEQAGVKSKYRVTAQLSAEARNNRDFTNRLFKGAMVEVSGRLTAAEEPRWPSRTILFEIRDARPLR